MKTRLPLLLLLTTACGPADSIASIDEGTGEAGSTDELRIPSENHAETLDVGSWNVEWFGATDKGPSDEALQQANVLKVLRRVDLDLVGLVEVVSEDAFHALLAGLPNHEGLLVTDPRVEGGAAYYSAHEQKVALIYRKGFAVDSARVVATTASYDFGGRPPMEVELSFRENGARRTLVVLVAHFKAMANADGWNRRTRSSAALKSYLDAAWHGRWALMVGDLNDDIDRSTYQGNVSPFSNFLGDSGHYRFTTDSLTTTNEPTTVGFRSTIDHHLASNTFANRFVEGSAKVLHYERQVANYGVSTSDHYPVLTRYNVR